MLPKGYGDLNFDLRNTIIQTQTCIFQNSAGARMKAVTEIPISKQMIDFADTKRGLLFEENVKNSCINNQVKYADETGQ